MIKRYTQKHRASTLQVDVSQARHFTFDFVNDSFVSVTRTKSKRKTINSDDGANKTELETIAEYNTEATENTAL